MWMKTWKSFCYIGVAIIIEHVTTSLSTKEFISADSFRHKIHNQINIIVAHEFNISERRWGRVYNIFKTNHKRIYLHDY